MHQHSEAEQSAPGYVVGPDDGAEVRESVGADVGVVVGDAVGADVG